MILLLKTLKYLLICLLVTVLLLLGTLALVLSTPLGSGWLVSQLRWMAGDTLQLAESRGAISSGLTLYDVRYDLPGGTLVLDELELRWQPASLFSARLQVDYLGLRGGEWVPAETAELATEPAGEGSFTWPSISLPVAVELEQLEFSGWRGVPAIEGMRFAASLAASGEELEIHSFSVQSDDIIADLSGELALTPPYSMNLESSWNYRLPDGQNLAGNTELFGNLNGLEIDNSLQDWLPLNSSGSLRLVDWQSGALPGLEQVRFDFQHRLQSYSLTRGENRLTLSNSQLYTAGQPMAITLELESGLALEGHPLATQGEVLMQARLDQLEQLVVQQFELDSGRGQLNLQGGLGWQQGLTWQGDISARNLDIVEQVQQLDADMQVAGSFDNELVLTTNIDSIIAELEGVSWQVSGNAQVRGDRVRLSRFSADSGAQQISLDGQVWPAPDVSFSATANSVSNLWPGLQAQVQGQGLVQGEWAHPRGNFDLQVTQLSMADFSLQRADLQLSPLQQDLAYSVRLQLAGFQQGSSPLVSRLLLTGEITPDIADLDIRATVPQGELATALQLDYPDLLQGASADDALMLAVESLSFSSAGALPGFELDDVANAVVSRQRQELALSCFRLDAGGQICLQGSRNQVAGGDASVQASLEATDLPTSLANPWLPADLQWQGALSASAELDMNSAEPLQLEAQIAGREGVLRLRQLAEGEEPLAYSDLQVSLRAMGEQWTASAATLFPGESPLDVSAQYNRQTGALLASADLMLNRLHWLEGISTRVEEPDGRAELRLQLDGTLEQPDFELFVDVTELQGMIVDSGVQLSDSWLRLEPNNGDSRDYVLQGRLNTGEGGADLQGHFQLAQLDNPAAQLSLQGENLQLFDRPDLSAWVSPDLEFSWRDGAGVLSGRVEMPRANLQMPKVGGSTLRRSADEIIIGQSGGEDDAMPRISGRVRVVIGEQVRLSGQGLETGLSGELDAEYTEEGELALYGTLSIGDGEYTAYGRTLEIQSGSLTFSGEAGNPGISIRAVQTYPEYEVGIQVTGTAQRPVTELFSNPAMPQTDILAILVTGRRLDRIAEGEAPSLLDAIDSMGIVGGESLSGRIESAFGLSEFRITDEEEGNSVVAGKFILPRLYVELVQSLFDRTSKLGLEYLVNDHLRVRAQSGDAQSMELIYVIERP